MSIPKSDKKSQPDNILYLPRIYDITKSVEFTFLDKDDKISIDSVRTVVNDRVPDKLTIAEIMKPDQIGVNMILIEATSLEVYKISLHQKLNIPVAGRWECNSCFSNLIYAEGMVICEECNEIVCESIKIKPEKSPAIHLNTTILGAKVWQALSAEAKSFGFPKLKWGKSYNKIQKP